MGNRQSDQEPARVAGQISQLVAEFWQWHSGDFSPVESWSPLINVYKLPRRIDVCVSLAGVDKRTIDVQVEPGLLTIRGHRTPPEPKCPPDQAMRILTMEIDHGPFCRQIGLPEQIDLTRVESEYLHGLLWVHLPLREQG